MEEIRALVDEAVGEELEDMRSKMNFKTRDRDSTAGTSLSLKSAKERSIRGWMNRHGGDDAGPTHITCRKTTPLLCDRSHTRWPNDRDLRDTSSNIDRTSSEKTYE